MRVGVLPELAVQGPGYVREDQAHLLLIHLHFTHQNVGFGWIPLFLFQETLKNAE